MQLPDVNVLIYAFREDSPFHRTCHDWLENALNGPELLGLSDVACSGFLRITTHPSIYKPPTPTTEALHYLEAVLERPNAVLVQAGSRHWDIFSNLCRLDSVRGKLVSDAYYAALAIESGSEWITMDRDFARFPGLRWRRPF